MLTETDGAMDRILSLRASSRLPLPPDICMADGPEAVRYRRLQFFFEVHGLSGHPVAEFIMSQSLRSAMSDAVSKASHLDRVMHYTAYTGSHPVRTVTPEEVRQWAAGAAAAHCGPPGPAEQTSDILSGE